jgi:glucose-1-phosphate cytidylyltransferase
MVTIGHKPILWHIMQIYARYGFKDFILALGYKGNMIRDYFLNYEFYNSDFTLSLGNHKDIQFHHKTHKETDWKVTLVETGDESMTGARVKLCERYIKGDDFFLTYGDGLADIDLQKLLQFHKRHGKMATVTGVNPPSRWGELHVKKDYQVVVFKEKAKSEKAHHVNGGFFVFSRRIFKYLRPDPRCILEDQVLEKLARERELMIYHHNGFWQCMDTYRDYLALDELSRQGEAPWERTSKTAHS